MIFWLLIFAVSLVLLVKGADWFLWSAEKIGLAIGLSPFVVGVLIVGFGTSLPELVSSIAATLRGVTEIVTANAVGSNIANILLVVGAAAIVGRRLTVTKDLIDLDLPLLALSTTLLLGVAWDKQIVWQEALLLLGAYTVYLLYTLLEREELPEDGERIVLEEDEATGKKKKRKRKKDKKASLKDVGMLTVGIGSVWLGAQYLVTSVITISELFGIGVGAITITAVALGTSLPELSVSLRAALKGKSEVAFGNIFGSNTFNALMVVGIPGLFETLSLDKETYAVGLPVMAVATLLFVISGISKRMYVWEGSFYVILYVLFTAKLFTLF